MIQFDLIASQHFYPRYGVHGHYPGLDNSVSSLVACLLSALTHTGNLIMMATSTTYLP